MRDPAAAGAPEPGAVTAERIAGLEERIAAENHELRRRAAGKCSAGPQGLPYLFIAGCPRSGTTALTTFLNGDDRLLLGQERFRRIRKWVEPFHFTEEVFFNPTLHETSWAMPWRGETVWPGTFGEYQELRARWRSGSVRIIGDKAPYYVRHLERLGREFPRARFAILVRDLDEVARSYDRRAANPSDHWPAENDHRLAARDWNDSLAHARAFAEQEAARLLVIAHERFFFGEPGELERLYAFLELDLSAAARERYAAIVADAQRRRATWEPLAAPVASVIDAARNRELEAWAKQAALG
ncbi:MAG TPA: sulfotransferase [Solirubrobacterales bacterium]|nr:sulfotransferase [Solirubrobacterales bacterium]